MKTIGQRIHYALKLRGMSQADLAKLTDSTRSNVSVWVNEKHTPNAHKQKLIAKALNVNYDWLAYGQGLMDISMDRMLSDYPAHQRSLAAPIEDARNALSTLSTLDLSAESSMEILGSVIKRLQRLQDQLSQSAQHHEDSDQTNDYNS